MLNVLVAGAGGGDRTRTTLGESRDSKYEHAFAKRAESLRFRPSSFVTNWLELGEVGLPLTLAGTTVGTARRPAHYWFSKLVS